MIRKQIWQRVAGPQVSGRDGTVLRDATLRASVASLLDRGAR